jgi:hypothetical protein
MSAIASLLTRLIDQQERIIQQNEDFFAYVRDRDEGTKELDTLKKESGA